MMAGIDSTFDAVIFIGYHAYFMLVVTRYNPELQP